MLLTSLDNGFCSFVSWANEVLIGRNLGADWRSNVEEVSYSFEGINKRFLVR